MIYLLEGPDASGKTTLANDEFLKRGFSMIHNGVFPSPEKAYLAYLMQTGRMTKESSVVIDRMHLSERIYGQIYHGEWMPDKMYWEIDKALERLDATLILCLTDFQKTISAWFDRRDNELVQNTNEFELIYRQYESIIYSPNAMAKYTKLPVVWYDYNNPINLMGIVQ